MTSCIISRCYLLCWFVTVLMLSSCNNTVEFNPKTRDDLVDYCTADWIKFKDTSNIVGNLISQEMPKIKKYLAIKTGGYGYSFEFFGISEKNGVYLHSTSDHISVSRYKETQANEIFAQVIDTEIEIIPDYYGDYELSNVVINGQDLCVILRFFDGDQTYEGIFMNPHFLISSRKLKNKRIEHDGVALLKRIENYFEHNLPLPLSKWKKLLNQGIVSDNSSVLKQERETFLSDARKNLFYEISAVEKKSSVE